MTRIILIITGFLTFLNLNGQNLEKHNWKNRILIVKTNNEGVKKYQEQLKEFRFLAKEFEERKIVLYQIEGTKYQLLDYENRNRKESGEVSKKMGEEILKEKDQFEVILIGLDGNIKLHETEILIKEKLLRIIDSMPMRQAELRIKK